MSKKVYVTVNAVFQPDGTIQPLCVIWEDGTRFRIDRIFDVRPAASLRAGGAGIRYTCGIRGTVSYLFLEGNRWFVEAKKPV
ncbi:MAG: hypothetical protein ACOYIC_00325 [Butyricicoccus sp.]|jgi:hypothetical protein|nr:hypothetical protein [Clostridiales bacterium]